MKVVPLQIALEKEEKLKDLNKKMKTLKAAYKRLQADFGNLEKENTALRSQAGIGNDKTAKIAVGVSEEELRSIKEKYEKEAFQSSLNSK